MFYTHKFWKFSKFSVKGSVCENGIIYLFLVMNICENFNKSEDLQNSKTVCLSGNVLLIEKGED